MKVQEIRERGYNKIADAAERNWTESESAKVVGIFWGFIWVDSPEKDTFWSHVDDGNFKAALEICPEYREDEKTKVNYQDMYEEAMEALGQIEMSCDNQNDSHEIIWKIAHETIIKHGKQLTAER